MNRMTIPARRTAGIDGLEQSAPALRSPPEEQP